MILEVRKISKSFDGLQVLNGFSTRIEEGTLMGIIGPNGAGKTTLLNIITGFLEPDSGQVFYRGQEITSKPAHRITTAGISRTFQDLRLGYEMSVLDNVLLARPRQTGEQIFSALLGIRWGKEEQRNREKAEEIIKFVGLAALQDELAKNLSYGQQKLLALACCLATDAESLILDEPVAGIAPKMRAKILKLMQELIGQGKTVLFIEHDIEAVKEIAQRVIVLDDGTLVADGKPEKVLTNPKIVEHYLE